MTESTASSPGCPPDAAGVGVRLRGVSRIFGTAPGAAHGPTVGDPHRRRTQAIGSTVAIDGIDLDVAAGDFVAVLGPSGCGKTTLLRLIAGLDTADRGSVDVGVVEEPSARRHRSIAYVFQDAHLLPWRDVQANVALPLELAGTPEATRRRAVDAAIERVGLADAASRYPAQLSGGMRMRVSLARALVTRPRLLLLDEPFAALDEITRQGLDEQLRQLWRDSGATVIFVTHSISEAAFLARRAVVLSARPARVVLEHELDLPVERTAELRTDARFAAQMRLLHRALREGGA
jgi:NitT/TauT family transport system ATP-binding protein